MNDETSIQVVEDGISAVGELIKAAGKTPEAKEAAKNLGNSAVTITKAINNILLPLAAINFAFDKARIYFAQKFEEDLSRKTEEIPPENISEPKASIAGPALQGLAFCHEEPSLCDMFLTLIATAIDNRTSSNAHPAFVEIIKQLTGEEASLIPQFLTNTQPSIQITVSRKNGNGSAPILRHLCNIESKTQQNQEATSFPTMIDNWVRLGLIEVKYDEFLAHPNAYQWAENHPTFLKFRSDLRYNNEELEVNFVKGFISPTELGKQFAKAVGITKTITIYPATNVPA